MKKSRLVIRNLWFYRKQYLAVLGGAALSIAVLTGALAVGDSVRFSLRKLAEVRLGKTRFVLQSKDHLFRDSLAYSLSTSLNESVVPLLLSEGIAVNPEKGTRINRLNVIGIDAGFSGFWVNPPALPGEDEAVISQNIASRLDLKPGDEFLLRISKQGNASQNAPFAADRTSSASLRLKVKAVAGDDDAGRFSLRSNQAAPFNIFVSLKQLNAVLELEGMANLLLVAGEKQTNSNVENLDSLLGRIWQPVDAGLKIKKISGTDQYEITSEMIFIDKKVAGAIISTIPGAVGYLTYLANTLSSGRRSTPYSFVTAGISMSHQQIIINQWLADDLVAGKGDTITMNYFVMGPLNSLKERSARFIVSSVIPMSDRFCDPSLMPDFPGMTDAGNCRDWETATPIDMKRIREKDERYWKDYRGTPKAFISLETGQQLWKNRFGNYTAFRFRADDWQVKEYAGSIMQKLNPSENGLLFIPVFEEGVSAAANSTDFGGLFLGLSFFIIIAGLLLMAMIFSVHVNTRLTETGVLSAIGFRKGRIFSILFAEISMVVLLASILGTVAGIGYNRLMLLGLNTLWQDSVRTSSLGMQVNITTLLAGAMAGIAMALLVLSFVLYNNLKNPLVVLFRGAGVHSFVRKRKSSVSEVHSPGFFALILRNMSLNLKRTAGAIVLLSIGTFTIIITGANRQTFHRDSQYRKSGTGGFLFWAESTIPVMYDLNTTEGKKHVALDNDSLFRETRFIQMYRYDGDDASCLNLNRVSQPAIMGIDVSFLDEISAFSFQTLLSPYPFTLLPSIPYDHPWRTLYHTLSNGIIPGFADESVIRWGLGKSVGDTLVYLDEAGKPLRVKLMGGLENSIFQGNILISDSLFKVHYPSVAGSKIMLVDGPYLRREAIGSELENIFRDWGMVVTPAAQRLDEFNTVQNTYLSVFMMLGGLGVIIGTFGLGFLLIRNIMDRQHELATYLALGFRKSFISRLLISEHLLILAAGIGIGIAAALLVILLLLPSPASEIPVAYLAVILSLILITGCCWIIFPVRAAMKRDIIRVLKKEG